MIYPTAGAYESAVRNADKFLLAPQFKGGTPLVSSHGPLQNGLVGYSGGYSVVYPILVGSKKLALRCWIKNPGDLKGHYAQARSYLRSSPLEYFVDFGYVDQGILVQGQHLPICYMDWVEGQTLSQYLDQHVADAGAMKRLSELFLTMTRELHNRGVSHGDLQDGNILVCGSNGAESLRLVDYDCVYVPVSRSTPNGHRLQGVPDYQHPQIVRKHDRTADYFSELVIYLSLLAYSEKSSFWNSGQEKKLLFSSADYENPSRSGIFGNLSLLSPEVQRLSLALSTFCAARDSSDLRPLEEVVGDKARLAASTPQALEQYFGAPMPPAPTRGTSAPQRTPTEIGAYFSKKPGATPREGTAPTLGAAPQKANAPVAVWVVLGVLVIACALALVYAWFQYHH